MFEDDAPRKRPVHEVGMKLDGLSVGELEERVEQLEAEIARVKAAIMARGKTRSEADAVFKL